jgi:CII-binding regulator of phage lambda lysogenization HflD
MMNILKLASDALPFFRKYWKEAIMVVLVMSLLLKMRYDYKQLELAYETSQESLKNQIEGLKDIHTEELVQRQQAFDQYKDKMAELERKYKKDREVIIVEREKLIERHIEDFQSDEQALIDAINEQYGFSYVP